MKTWKHVFKLDPAKEISDEQLELLCESGTDAVIAGGTDHVTLDGVLDLLSRIRRYTIPCTLEITTMEAITPGFDYYFMPIVMNRIVKKRIMDIQHQSNTTFKNIV